MKFQTSETLPKYFKSIKKYKPLSSDREKELARLIQLGDDSAFTELVSSNFKIVVTIANRHIGQGVPIDDLIQEGNIGLMEAARRFSEDAGTRFISYAQLWIRKRINETVAKTGRIVRLPHNQEYDIYKSKMAKLSEEDEVKTGGPRQVDIDSKIGDEDGSTIGDIILKTNSSIETSIEFDHIRFQVTKIIGELKNRDREIIMDYFGIDREYAMPTDIIAEKHGMTAVRVSQIVKASLTKLKQLI